MMQHALVPAVEVELGAIQTALRNEKPEAEQEFEQTKAQLNEMKTHIKFQIKQNYVLSRNLDELDKKIGFLIRNQAMLDEVLTHGYDLLDESMNSVEGAQLSQSTRSKYAELLSLLQNHPRYLASIIRRTGAAEVEPLTQATIFTLFGDQFDPYEEHMLLVLFQLVLREEFNACTSLGTFMRGNTAFTRMLSKYMGRTFGVKFLKSTYSPILTELFAQTNLNLDITPITIYRALHPEANAAKPLSANEQIEKERERHQRISSEIYTSQQQEQEQELPQPSAVLSDATLEAREDVKAVLEHRTALIEQWTGRFLQALFDKLELIPYGVRWICKQIYTLSRKRASDIETYPLVGGVLFLRFVLPSLLQAYEKELVESKPKPEAVENLKLITKIIMSLSNAVLYKGSALQRMNSYLERTIPQVHHFFSLVCDVPELEDRLPVEQYLSYIRSSDDEKLIQITMGELYLIHSLCIKHRDILTDGPLDPLLPILHSLPHPLPPSTPSLSKESVHLKLSSLTNRDIVAEEGASEENQSSFAKLFEETKIQMCAILRQSPPLVQLLAGPQPPPSPTAQSIGTRLVACLDTLQARLSTKLENQPSVVAVRMLIRNLNRLSQQFGENSDYVASQLIAQLNTEAGKRDSMRATMNAQMETLKTVLSDIDGRRKRLEQRKEMYAQYLSNIRDKFYGGRIKSDSVPATSSVVNSTSSLAQAGTLLGPFTFDHSILVKRGIIFDCIISPKIRNKIQYQFSTDAPGVFHVTALLKKETVLSARLDLEELIDRQQKGRLNYEVPDITFRVKPLLLLLNVLFCTDTTRKKQWDRRNRRSLFVCCSEQRPHSFSAAAPL